MKTPLAIQHQFEFWTHIGQVGGYLYNNYGYTVLSPKNTTWPSKIFGIQKNHIAQLQLEIESHHLPRSLALSENEMLETLLHKQGFTRTSSVEAMTMEVKNQTHYTSLPEIEKITDNIGIKAFVKIASEAFDYTIYESTIAPLVRSTNVQLFLGNYQNDYVSCGIVFKDSNGDSGLHMIGAKKEYRGLGLGKKMTQHLLHIAISNSSERIHLVASKLGAPIYYKLGFQNRGYLKSYTF